MPLAQTTCSGTAFDEQGNAVSGVQLRVVKAIKSGVLIQQKPRTIATSNASGVFERSTGVADFLLPRNSTVWLEGKFYVGSQSFNSSSGFSVAIPDAATATLESLGAAAVVPTQGLTVKSNGTSLADLIGTFNFSTAFTVTESPTGTALIGLVGGGGAWGSITGTLSAQTDLQTALNLLAPKASPTFTGTVAGITSTMVGLGNVDNTSDVNKPVSTAQQTALNLKANLISPSFTTPALGVATGTSLTLSGGTLAATFNQNAGSDVAITNTTSNTAAYAGFIATNGASILQVMAFSGSYTAVAAWANRGVIASTGNSALVINARQGGIEFYTNATGGTAKWTIASTGHLLTGTDNTYDIGATGATRPRNIYAGGSVLALGPGSAATGIGTAPTQGQTLTILQAMELLTIAAAPTTTTTMLVPANVIVLSVSVRVTTVIPTAATFTVKIGAQAFNTVAVPVAATTTDSGTAAGAWFNATAQGVVITPNLTPGAATGVVRITVSYIQITPPTS